MDWRAWHAAYDRDTPLRHRLQIVQHRIREALTAAAPGPIRVISVCAGDGRDLLGALRGHPRRRDVRARLVELDEELAAAAARRAPPNVEVIAGDASTTTTYAGAVPADLVLVCGVFGNVRDADIARTIGLLPSLAARRATVIWTRHRREPDRTPAVRRWFAETGFVEKAFDAPAGFHFSVGVHDLVAEPAAFRPGKRMFGFLDRSADAR